MSDYGDDYSDYGEDWFYVEEEYMVADDLAEHAVQSPPPMTCDEDMLPEWDRFDYFNDLEYASDGYDDAAFEPHNNGKSASKIGQKRKRGATATRGRKKQRLGSGNAGAQDVSVMFTNSPVVWRSQAGRGAKPKLLAEDAETYALLKDWREKLADVPEWAQQSPHADSPGPSSKTGKAKAAFLSEPILPTSEPDVEEEEDAGIDPAALVAALRSRLAAAGGPLSGMDPQQLLQFAMRMANDQDAGDDIAGEMADEMLNQGDEEDDEEAEVNLLSWVAAQRNKNTVVSGGDSGMVSTLESPDAVRRSNRPPTPPSSEATRSVRVPDEVVDEVEPKANNAAAFAKNSALDGKQASRKRKADDAAVAESSTNATKRRATRSYDAPTAASQARTVPSKTTRSGRVNR